MGYTSKKVTQISFITNDNYSKYWIILKTSKYLRPHLVKIMSIKTDKKAMISRKAPNFSAGETLLFEVKNQRHNQSQLKDFIHFIKYCGRRGAIRFKHIEENAELLGNLTLKENLLLDLGQRNHTELKLCDLLEKEKRPKLAQLAKEIRNENSYPSQASFEDKKLISLIKVLLDKSEYLFLEKPEKNLSSKLQDLFFEALMASKEKYNQTIFITSEHRNLWQKYIDKIVTKSPSGHFKLDDTLQSFESSNITPLKISADKFNSKKAA